MKPSKLRSLERKISSDIKAMRTAASYDIEAAARHIGMPEDELRQIESGKIEITVRQLLKIADAYQISARSLLPTHANLDRDALLLELMSQPMEQRTYENVRSILDGLEDLMGHAQQIRDKADREEIYTDTKDGKLST